MNEEKRYKIQFIDNAEDKTRTVRLSLRSLRLLAVGAGAAIAVLAVGSVLSVYTLMTGYGAAARGQPHPAGADPTGVEKGFCPSAGS